MKQFLIKLRDDFYCYMGLHANSYEEIVGKPTWATYLKYTRCSNCKRLESIQVVRKGHELRPVKLPSR